MNDGFLIPTNTSKGLLSFRGGVILRLEMKTRNTWGGSFLAMLFAVLIVAGAYWYYTNNKIAPDAIISSGTSLTDWHTISNTIPSTNQNITTSEALSTDLYNNYLTLAQSGTFTASELNSMLATLAERHITNPAVVPIIHTADLNLSDTTSVDTYTKLLAVVMNQAGLVKRYEVAVFTESVTAENIHGTPELQETADLYKRIAAALLVMEVPSQLAKPHLEAVKSIGALARSVEIMAHWQGDPIEALADVDTFNKAQSYVTVSMENLLASITSLQKKV